MVLEAIVLDPTSDADHKQVSLRVKNASSKARDWCLIKINRVQASQLLLERNSVSPVSRAFRTSGQQARNQWNRFGLAPYEWKDVVIGTIHRRYGALTLLYEGGKAYVELVPPAKVDIGIYGAQEPTLTVLTPIRRNFSAHLS
ncbi:MAG: hypothetical protein LC667_19500 [Thioalkalivibrio sp.]|nr:hypothetical protein [Thioalkalivibrio sp.]